MSCECGEKGAETFTLGNAFGHQFYQENVDDNYLSIGNLCRLIKEIAINKSAAVQSEIFCLLFEEIFASILFSIKTVFKSLALFKIQNIKIKNKEEFVTKERLNTLVEHGLLFYFSQEFRVGGGQFENT